MPKNKHGARILSYIVPVTIVEPNVYSGLCAGAAGSVFTLMSQSTSLYCGGRLENQKAATGTMIKPYRPIRVGVRHNLDIR